MKQNEINIKLAEKIEQTSRREKMKAVVAEIAEHFGYEQQKNMLIEEQAELIQALNKFDRKGTEESFNNIIEEMADVELMIDQVRYLLDISKEAVEEIKAEKVKRTLLTIELIKYNRRKKDNESNVISANER